MQLAGVNVLALINEHLGAALQYGIDKDSQMDRGMLCFMIWDQVVLMLHLCIFLLEMPRSMERRSRLTNFRLRMLGGIQSLVAKICKCAWWSILQMSSTKQVQNGVDVRKFPKAMAKLKKQTITRKKFEELCEDLWERSLIPVKEVVKNSGLKVDEIYAVELIGGATRVPKLQAKLQEFLGRKDLDRHLDADEAIVLGAALHAANLSDGIKLNRNLGMVDGSSYGLVVELDGPGLLKDESTRQLIAPRMKVLPTKIFFSEPVLSLSSACEAVLEINNAGMTTTTLEVSH